MKPAAALDAELLEQARELDGAKPEPGAESQTKPGSQTGPETGAPGAAPGPEPLEKELAGMFAMIGAGVGKFLPSVGALLDEKQCGELGQVLAPVATKYGIDKYLAGLQWRAELRALFVVVPLAIAIRQAALHDIAELKRAAADEGGAASSSSSPDAPPPGEPTPKAQMLRAVDTTP